MLAAHAALAIESARLYERSRELSAIEERNRLARDLHDSVVQKLFGIVLEARSASVLLERDPEAAREPVERLGELAQEAIGELRSLVFQLRPAAVETDGLGPALRKHVEVLRRVHRREIELELSGGEGLAPATAAEVFRIAQEALGNALRHSQAAHIAVRLSEPNGLAAPDRRGRRRRLRAGLRGAALATARPHLDGGAGGRARRQPQRRVAAGRGRHDRAGGAPWRVFAS